MNMNYNKIVLEYINKIKPNEPIFIEDIKYNIKIKMKNEITNDEINKIFENINVILNRLKQKEKIRTFYKGIYYKPIKNIFGEMPLDKNKVIEKKYLKDNDGNVKGYITGAKLFNKIGLTTQVPNITHIMTNECKNKNEYKNKYLNVVIRKQKIKINNENYKYLQLIDIINNKDKINIENNNYKEKIYEFIKYNNLDFEKIIKYARDTKNKKVLDMIYILAR